MDVNVNEQRSYRTPLLRDVHVFQYLKYPSKGNYFCVLTFKQKNKKNSKNTREAIFILQMKKKSWPESPVTEAGRQSRALS